MWIDYNIKTSEIPAEMVEHLKIVRDYLRKEFGYNCDVSIDGITNVVFRI